MKTNLSLALVAASLLFAAPAQAATDYLLELGGVDGEAGATVPVESWAFSVCDKGRCGTSSTSRQISSSEPKGKRVSIQASHNSQSLRGPSADGTNAGEPGAAPAADDLDADGTVDFTYVSTQPEVSGLTFQFDKASPYLAKMCMGKHIAKAMLRSSSESFELIDATVSCTASESAAPSGRKTIDTTPARISTNLTTARKSADQPVREECDDACSTTLAIVSGQMRHTKTGHVTILK